MRILFLETEPAASEVRIRPLLDHLVRAGDIVGYAIADRTMAVHGPLDSYDVALTHRIPSRRQFFWLQRNNPPFIYDIDDLLFRGSNDQSGGRRRSEQTRIEWCLSNSRFVTCPSMRLVDNISAHFNADRRDRFKYLPNAGRDTPAPLKRSSQPSLLWASSAAHIWTDELHSIACGLELARRELRCDILLLGRFPTLLYKIIGHHRSHDSWLPYPTYLNLLENSAFVAIAPLAGDLPSVEQAFVDSKSDVKAAQYGSSRIAGAYSARPPYAESDLPCQLVASNTTELWRDAIGTLLEGFPGVGNKIGDHHAFLTRRPRVVAKKLFALLDTARQEDLRPFRFLSVPTPRFLGRLERRVRHVRSWLRNSR